MKGAELLESSLSLSVSSDRAKLSTYTFVSERVLADLRDAGQTLWIVELHDGMYYSVTEQAIWEALREGDSLACIAISRDRHVTLARWCRKNGIKPINIHLKAPRKSEQERRMLERDEKVSTGRIRDTRKFERRAQWAFLQLLLFRLRLHFVSQDTVEEMRARIMSIIGPT